MADLNIALILRLVDRASAPARRVMAQLDRVGGDRWRAAVGRVTQGTGLMGEGFSSLGGAAVRAAAVVGGIGAAAAGIAAKFVPAAAQMERFKVQLTNLEGSAEGADRAMAWINEFATKTPLELEDTISAYARLKAFGLDPTNGSLMAMVDTMAASGGGVEQLDGLVLALGQAWTKGKLQGEEALQMLERGVPVWDLLSQKMGKSAADLQEMASKGQLGRKEIQLLIDALAERNAGASENMSKTWDGIISNIMDHWGRFQLMVMDAGVFEFLKDKLQDVLDLLNAASDDGRLQAWAEQMAAVIMTAFGVMEELAQQVLVAWEQLFPWLEAAAEWLGGWHKLAMAIAAIGFAPTLLSIAAALIKVAQGIALVASGVVTLNPITLAIIAIAAAAYLIYRNWEPVVAWFGRLWEGIAGYFQGFSNFLIGVFTGDLGRAWDGIRQMWSSAIGVIEALWSGLGWSIVAVWTDIIAPVLDKLGLLDPIIAAWEAFQSAIGKVLDWIGTKFQSLWDRIRPVIDALKWVRERGAAALDAVGLGGGDEAAGTGGASGSWESEGTPPGRATGGPVRAGEVYRWQEQGEEMFVPRTDGLVISNRTLRAMRDRPAPAPSVSIGGITINAAPGQDPSEIARAVRRELARIGREHRVLIHDGGAYDQ